MIGASSLTSVDPRPGIARNSQHLPIRVVVLRNFLGPYEIPWLQELQRRVSDLCIVATRDRNDWLPWTAEVGNLNVVQQGRFILHERQSHAAGFVDRIRVHVPYGTLKQLHRLSPDAIISSEFGVRSLQALTYSRLSKRTKLLVFAALSERSEAGRGFARRAVRRFLAHRVAAFVTPGASGARYLENLGVEGEKIFIVPRTTDMTRFLDIPLDRNDEVARRLFCPGQFIPRKGLRPFLKAVARWATDHGDQRAELCFLGDGPERLFLETNSRPSNLVVRFWKGVSYDELPAYYAQAGILAFPTLADEWGLVVNEALASGVPVLGSIHSQAVTEMVRDEVNGWIFNPEKPEQMYTAIHRALTAPTCHLSKMRITARDNVKRFTPAYAADQILQALNFTCFSRGTD